MAQPVSKTWYEAALEWVDLEAAANLLEECKSSTLSQMMAKLGDIPVSRAETKVKSSPEWEEYVKKTVTARTKANLAKVKMEYYRMRFFEWQSQQATERVEAQL